MSSLNSIFWIPVRIGPFQNKFIRDHSELKCTNPFGTPLKKKIESKNGNQILLIAEVKAGNIEIYFSEDRKGINSDYKECIFKLNYIWHCDSGFVEYKALLQDVDYFSKYSIEQMWSVFSVNIYRLVKKLYHTHKFHKANEYFIAASVIPYYSSAINVDPSRLNKFKLFYFDEITLRIKSFRDFIRPRMETKLSLKFRYAWFNLIALRSLIILRKDLDRKYEVNNYLKVLKSEEQNLGDKLVKLYTYLDDIISFRTDLCDVYNARRATQSVVLGSIGFVLGIISILLSFYWSNETNKSQVVLTQHLDSIIFDFKSNISVDVISIKDTSIKILGKIHIIDNNGNILIDELNYFSNSLDSLVEINKKLQVQLDSVNQKLLK